MVGQAKKLIDNMYGVKTQFGRIWIPLYGNLRERNLDEAHNTRYSIHPRATKMYQDLRKDYW
jgi:hypothetical protein